MYRLAEDFLQDWLCDQERKPLVLRGARQVGKTWLVRQLAKKQGRRLIEVNFEKNKQILGLFDSNDPQQILLNLSARFNQPISPATHLLFLDEIQAAPEILAKLRWFAEDLATMPVIAAGSLLDFVLHEHEFSMPVGRISYLHLEPLNFEEFLLAKKLTQLADYLKQYQLTQEIPDALHQQCLAEFDEYILVGGMPAAVSSWSSKGSLQKLSQIHHDLITTYIDDFAKYPKKVPLDLLHKVMNSIPNQLGKKFVYSHVVNDEKTTNIKRALDLLKLAKICHSVGCTAANGLPLAAELNNKFFKMIFLDVGLVSTMLGLRLDEIKNIKDITLINNGNIAEQVVGQLLRTNSPFYIEPNLFYWQRTAKEASAEVDYVLQSQNQIIPVEVKAGTTGQLKSLHLLMSKKKLTRAIRINSGKPSITDVDVKIHSGEAVQYQLHSLPFYLLHQLNRLIHHNSQQPRQLPN